MEEKVTAGETKASPFLGSNVGRSLYKCVADVLNQSSSGEVSMQPTWSPLPRPVPKNVVFMWENNFCS